MKKRMIPLLALLLAAVLLLAGCANHGKTMIEVGSHEISVNVYKLYLSRYRGLLSESGYSVNSDKFWSTYLKLEGMTVSEYHTDHVFEGLKQIAAALYLYDELGLKLNKETEDSIDEWIDTLIEEVGGGSKSQLNSILSPYGANITVLRDAALIEAKIEQLKVHLYGEEGELLSGDVKEEFYQKSYYRGYQMLLANYYYEHETYEGDSVYFTKDGKIAYDTKNGTATADTDKNGDTVYREFGPIAYDKVNGIASEERDAEGYIIYYKDGKIAYDTEAGKATEDTDKNGDTVYRKWVIAYDTVNGKLQYTEKDGKRVVKYYSEEDMGRTRWMAEQIAEKCEGDEELFLMHMEQYSDNLDFTKEYTPNGMYFVAGAYTGEEVFNSFSTELSKLEVGELTVHNSDVGYYVLMRAELDEGAWADSENSRWFTSLTGLCMEYMLQLRSAEYLDKVEVNEELRDSVDITMVGTNLYY